MIKNKILLFVLINAICSLFIILLKGNGDCISVVLVISSLIINIHSFCLLPVFLVFLERKDF